MRFDVVTLFPELFTSPLATGLVGKAIEAKSAEVGFVDPRAFTKDRHRSVDDTPYGGGGGMVMKPDPVGKAIAHAVARGGGPVLLMTPQGRPVTQRDFERWSKLPHLVLVAGRYEGFDERIRELADEEVSLGDFVLTGGEYAALTIIDGVVRLLPGTLGNASSSEEDSFSDGLLEYPHYTRPPALEGRAVPDVLLSGNHADIAAWRHAESLARTRRRRPDLLAARGFSAAERRLLQAVPPDELAVEIAVVLEAERESAAELAERTSTILRLAMAYGLARAHFVLAPAIDPEANVAHEGLTALAAALAGDPDRADAPSHRARVRVHATVGALAAALSAEALPPFAVSALAGPPTTLPVLAPGEVRRRARAAGRRVLLVLGSGAAGMPGLEALLPSIRVASAANALPLGAAAAVLLDRLVHEG